MNQSKKLADNLSFKRIVIGVCIIITIQIVLIVGAFFILRYNRHFSADFADEITLRFEYGTNQVHVKVTDEEDVSHIKALLNGYMWRSSPSCGFSEQVSITLNSSGKTVVLCLASDGCPIFCVNNSDHYFDLSEEDWDKLHEILAKYGFIFPCI